MSVRLVGLSGSLRQTSVNTALLRTAADRAPSGVELRIEPLDDLPFYNADLESTGLPAPVARLHAAVANADGLLLAFPEYNWSVPAVMKNALDWLSRGGVDSPLHRLPVGMMSAAGGSGGRRAQAHMVDVLGHNEADVVGPAVRIARGGQHVVDGRLGEGPWTAEVDALLAALADRARVVADAA
ncbi:NADPH-dependent FMN reductase [Euzebya sp.]|uniref:NADPH-dependent FMN reductase n=1 Tax=Euzebya sp. TaxID=1971409 RepID=UPI0035175485